MSTRPEPSKLRWRCRRGTKELDTLTERYLDQHFSAASQQEQRAFAQLLELQDPELYKILTRELIADDELINSIVEKINKRKL